MIWRPQSAATVTDTVFFGSFIVVIVILSEAKDPSQREWPH
jgi:hypothetical protein